MAPATLKFKAHKEEVPVEIIDEDSGEITQGTKSVPCHTREIVLSMQVHGLRKDIKKFTMRAAVLPADWEPLLEKYHLEIRSISGFVKLLQNQTGPFHYTEHETGLPQCPISQYYRNNRNDNTRHLAIPVEMTKEERDNEAPITRTIRIRIQYNHTFGDIENAMRVACSDPGEAFDTQFIRSITPSVEWETGRSQTRSGNTMHPHWPKDELQQAYADERRAARDAAAATTED